VPEVLAGKRYKSKVDVWSFGMIVYLILLNKLLFDPSLSPESIKQALIGGAVPVVPRDLRDFPWKKEHR
jgi:serine/threonine protein kinase